MTNYVTVNGNTYNDGSVPPGNMANDGHRVNLIPMFSDTIIDLAGKVAAVDADAAAVDADAAAAAASAAAAAASAAAAAALAGSFVGTSTTSLLIGPGSKTFVTQAGELYTPGVFMTAVSAANNANFMAGQVISYVGTNLNINVFQTGGTGTFADWNLSIAGVQGPPGTGITPQAIGWTGTGGTVPKTLTVDANLIASELIASGNANITASGAISARYNRVYTSAPISVPLPAAPALNEAYFFEDMPGNFGVWPMTLTRNGLTIMGLAEDLICNTPGISFWIWYDGTTWRLK